jgi:hypothetical protein
MKTIALGSTYSFRIAKERVGVCRVIQTHPRHGACVMVMKWEGPASATLAKMKTSVAFRRIQTLTHHSWDDKPLGHFTTEAKMPRSFRFLGIEPPTVEESGQVFSVDVIATKDKSKFGRIVSIGSASGLIFQAKLQWRWDHEREKVLAEDRKEARREELEGLRADKALEALKKKGPRALVKRKYFTDFRPPKMRAACQRLLRDVLHEILAIERNPKRDARILAKQVRAFNELDGSHGRRFDTIDAEQIMMALSEIATACGISDAMFERVVDGERGF